MALPFGAPIVAPALVGRAVQLEALGRCLDQAREGRGQVLLVSGEAGIGKSRLVAETEAQADARGPDARAPVGMSPTGAPSRPASLAREPRGPRARGGASARTR